MGLGEKPAKKRSVNSVNSVNKNQKQTSTSSFPVVNRQNIKCLYTNADQYMNKRNEMHAQVQIHNPDIIAITEVKPKQQRFKIQDCEISIDGYELFHNLEEEGRGVALLVKQELKPTPHDAQEATFSEHLFVNCTKHDGTQMVIGLIYRSPGSSMENNEKLYQLIRNTSDIKKEDLLLIGDFNLPSIDWEHETCSNNENHMASQFLQAYTEANLYQHQKNVTRVRKGEKPNILDLVLTNKEDMVKEITTEAGLGKSDHLTLIITLNTQAHAKEQNERFCYNRTDEKILKDKLRSVNWDKTLEETTVDQAWDKIKEKIFEAVTKSTPVAKSSRKKKTWMDQDTLTTIRKKYKLFRRWLGSRQDQDYSEYIKARNKARKACRKAQADLEKRLAAEAKANPNGIWKYAKARTTCRQGIPDLKRADGSKTKTDIEKAELLNDFFKSVFTTEDPGPVPRMEEYDFKEVIDNIDIKKEQVEKILSELQHGKAAGPDKIPPAILAIASKELAEPLTYLFRKTLEEGKLPQEWKKACVTPIYKRKGSKTSPNNYRPVSLTCVVGKVMEKIVRQVVMDHLTENKIITKEQHGFIQGRSCTTQLLEALDEWTEAVDDGGSVDIIYTDFQKAFDSVPHRRLAEKIHACGIRGTPHRWIRNFLENRKQTVVVGGTTSQEGNVTSGIPQGSVLGPILFLIFINDLPQNIKSKLKIFADDTKLYARVDEEDENGTKIGAENLQEDIDELTKWADTWQLNFHPDKCCLLKLGPDVGTSYDMESVNKDGNKTRKKLNEVQDQKDLGVTVDRDLSFKKQVTEATLSANRVVGVIRRSFDYLTPATFKQLFTSMVRPILEYGHCVWKPNENSQKGLCKELENVQRRATKMLGTLKNLPYPERLRRLELPSLEHRRHRGDMIETYKYLHGFYNVQGPSFQLAKDTPRDTRGTTLKVTKPRYNQNTRGNYFRNRVVNGWNDLPENIVSAPSLNSFKNRLDRHWASLPTRYDPVCLQ